MLHAILNHLYSVGVASGVVVSCIVALAAMQLHRKLHSNSHLLPSILLVLGLSAFSNALLDIFIRGRELPIWELPSPLNLLVGPVFLFRLRSLNQEPVNKGQVLLHALPFIIVSLVVGSYLWGTLSTQLYAETAFNRMMEHGLRALSFAAFLQVALYLYLCRQSLATYHVRLEQNCSSLDKINQDWIAKCLISLLVAFTLLTIIYALNHHHVYIPVNKSLAVIYAGIAYYLCFITLTRPMLLGSVSLPISTETPNKYQRSGLESSELKTMFERLQKLMHNEKPYCDPEVNLTALAELLGCSTQQLSQCINTCAKQNFYEYVNKFRLEAVKLQLSNVNSSNKSILDIAFDSGFNSKATFNRYFKTQLGCTPSEYRKSQSIG